VEGAALVFARDCAVLATAELRAQAKLEAGRRRWRQRRKGELPPVGEDELRQMARPNNPLLEPPRFREVYLPIARRYASRTGYSGWNGDPPIPRAILSGLRDLAYAMVRHVVGRMDRKAGFKLPLGQGDVAVWLVNWAIHSRGRRSGKDKLKLSPFFEADGDATHAPKNPMASPHAVVALHGLLLTAPEDYWPFRRCAFDECGGIFVPEARKQLFCSTSHRKAAWHKRTMKALGPEGEARRSEERERSRRNRDRKREKQSSE